MAEAKPKAPAKPKAKKIDYEKMVADPKFDYYALDRAEQMEYYRQQDEHYRKLRAEREAAKEAQMKEIEGDAGPETETIFEFKNGCTIVALNNNQAYRKFGEGCMKHSGPGNIYSYDWQKRQESKEFRGCIIQDKKGTRIATIVLEWEDYQDEPKPGQRKDTTYCYSGYGKRGRHGVKAPFCPFGDGEEYYFNHFGHFEWTKIQPMLAEWFLACGGKLAKDECKEMIACTDHQKARLVAKMEDKAAFEKAHPGEDYAYRANFDWKGNGWEKLTDRPSYYD